MDNLILPYFLIDPTINGIIDRLLQTIMDNPKTVAVAVFGLNWFVKRTSWTWDNKAWSWIKGKLGLS